MPQPRSAPFCRNFTFVQGVQWCVSLSLTVAAIGLHVRYFIMAGPLWRDEVHSVNLAAADHFSDVLDRFRFDSFPILWQIVLWLWQHCGMDNTDRELRLLGFGIGLSIVAATWCNAVRMGISTPICSLSLLAFTSAIICYGDSVRGYGLGMLLVLLAFGQIWQVTQQPTVLTVLTAMVLSLLSVHALYYNCVILLAIGCGGMTVAIVNGHYKRAWLVLGIGFISAISMLLYIPVIDQERTDHLYQSAITFASIVDKLSDALKFTPDTGNWRGINNYLWGIIVLVSLIAAVVGFRGRRRNSTPARRRNDAGLYCFVTLILVIPLYLAFLRILSYPMAPWYFLAGLTLVSGCIDGLLATISLRRFHLAVAAGAALFAINSALPVWRDVGVRRSNADLTAASLQAVAHPGDVILVSPWYYGVSLNRYYHGEIPLLTIPPMKYLDYQRYELLLEPMREAHPMQPVEQMLSDALRSGHQVWWVGFFQFPVEQLPPPPPPASQSQGGRDHETFTDYWALEIGHFLTSHRGQSERYENRGQVVSTYERFQLEQISGWK